MPAPGSGASACSCSNIDLGIVGAEDPLVGAFGFGQAPLILAATGTICSDTQWDLSTEWTPTTEGGAEPTITAAGNTAWLVSGTAAGELVISPAALCGGAVITLPTITITIGAALGWVDGLQFVNIFNPQATSDFEVVTKNGTDNISLQVFNDLFCFLHIFPGQKLTAIDVAIDFLAEARTSSDQYRYWLQLHSDHPTGDWNLYDSGLKADAAAGTFTVDEEFEVADLTAGELYFYVDCGIASGDVTMTLRRLRFYFEAA